MLIAHINPGTSPARSRAKYPNGPTLSANLSPARACSATP
ncbi:MAG: hypothetical protein V7642_6150, partial [Burkholderiales bacterium]